MEERYMPVDYNDEQHLYSFRGTRYLSATQIVDQFKNKFEADQRAIAYAAKHGGTPEYWEAKWAEKRDKSLERGNAIHQANETALQARMIDVVGGKIIPVQNYTDADPWEQRPDGTYTEALLWHHGYRIAGRSDKVILESVKCIRHAEPGDKIYYAVDDKSLPDIRMAHIDDYKTNEKLDRVSYQFRNGNYKMMLFPLTHLMDCTFVHYSLQLSLYMFMLEYQGFRPGKMTITHYPHPSEDNPNPQKEIHDVPYLKREVLSMLANLKR